jgi:SAM-dependent methyltransferase
MSRARSAAKDRGGPGASGAFDKYEHQAATRRSPEDVARILDDLYRESHGEGARATTLREDYCGTLANCCAWVGLDSERRAVGVDQDVEALEYGRARHLARLEPAERERVEVLEQDPARTDAPADVIATLNYSLFGLKTRPELLTYLQNCRRTLAPEGALVLEWFGGLAVRKANVERTKFPGFTYVVEQEGFDPVTHEAAFRVDVNRRGEKKQVDLFTYDWRIWSVPELIDALTDAGFADVRTYSEQEPSGADRFGDFVPAERANRVPNRSSGLVVGLR